MNLFYLKKSINQHVDFGANLPPIISTFLPIVTANLILIVVF